MIYIINAQGPNDPQPKKYKVPADSEAEAIAKLNANGFRVFSVENPDPVEMADDQEDEKAPKNESAFFHAGKKAGKMASKIAKEAHKDAKSDRHVLDAVLEYVKKWASDESIEARYKNLFHAAYIALYVCMALAAFYGVLVAFKTDRLSPIFIGLGGILAVGMFQFFAKKIFNGMEMLVKSTQTKILPTVPDCFAIFCLFAGVFSVVTLSWSAYQFENKNLLLIGITVFFSMVSMTILLLHPKTMNVEICTDLTAGDEAVGIMSFVMKILARMLVVGFCVGVITGTTGLLIGAAYFMRGEEYHLKAIEIWAPSATSVASCSLALPLGYLLFAFYYLTIALTTSILSIPKKLDALSLK